MVPAPSDTLDKPEKNGERFTLIGRYKEDGADWSTPTSFATEEEAEKQKQRWLESEAAGKMAQSEFIKIVPA